jgi:hypothetical protein
MGRRKRNSRIIQQANERLNGLKTIDPAFDLGNGLSVAALEQAITTLRAKLDMYNQKLSEIDEDLLAIETDENKIEDMNTRVLAGVGARFGRNSIEYEKAGGVRSADRKRPASKKRSKKSS